MKKHQFVTSAALVLLVLTACTARQEVNLNLGGESISLPQAIREGRLSIPELFAFARLDAKMASARKAMPRCMG